MKLFKRKSKKPARAGSSASVDAAPPSDAKEPAPASHRLTMDLAHAETLARMLAASRASNAVDVADLLAGMYIYEWDRLSKYWEDQEAVELFLQQICRISPQRWHSWIQLYDKSQHPQEEQANWLALGKRKEEKAQSTPLPRSAEVESLLRNAEMVTPFRDKLDGRSLPILTSESVLLCIALNSESEISRKLTETGLDVVSLEKAARDRRRAPVAWREDS
jgi:hypothetical protein